MANVRPNSYASMLESILVLLDGQNSLYVRPTLSFNYQGLTVTLSAVTSATADDERSDDEGDDDEKED